MRPTSPPSKAPVLPSGHARRGSARKRQVERRSRRQSAPVGQSAAARFSIHSGHPSRPPVQGDVIDAAMASLRAALRNISWTVVGGQAALVLIVLLGLIFVFSLVVTYSAGTILPGVSSIGVNLSGMDEAQAVAALQAAWERRGLTLHDGDRTWQVAPADLGFRIDTVSTARRALRYGREDGGLGAMIGAVLGGAAVPPVIELDLEAARDGLYRVAEMVDVRPRNATLQMQGVIVTHIPAAPGRRLNTALLLSALDVNPGEVIADGVINLPMIPIAPDVTDATPLVEFAQTLIGRPLVVEAYDPVSNQSYTLVSPSEQWGQWLGTRLVYEQTGPRLYLSLSAAQVRSYLEAQAATLPPPLTLDIGDGIQAIQDSVANGSLSTWVTVRYLPTVYTVQRGETAYSISRTEGIPFYMIQQANPGRDLSVLYVGDQINLPSRDLMIPLRPVRNKRVVVDLSDQYMWAYENGQVVFEWAVSTGIPEAPTSSGVFQILSHEERAYGSGFALCDENGNFSCGQWVMHWFMGVYEAVPGLMNGFHGAVELPDGRYLGGGNVGRPYTYGCIMMLDGNAERFYHWAEEGVVVEIRQ